MVKTYFVFVGLHQVVPTNVEKIMMTHWAIQDVGVVGLPDDVDGERPLAFVVLVPGQNVTADELIAFTNGIYKIILIYANGFEF